MSELAAPAPGSPPNSPSRPGLALAPPGAPGDALDGQLADHDGLPAQLVLASAHLKAGRLVEAGAAVSAVLRQAPRDVRALNLLGLVHFRSGQLTQARAVYLRLLDEHPSDTALRLNVGLVELRRGEAAAAVHHLRHVAQTEPDNLRALGYYGLALLRTGDLERARQVLLRAGQPELLAQVDQLLAQQPPAPTAALLRPRPETRVATESSSPPSGEGGPPPAALPPDAADAMAPEAVVADAVVADAVVADAVLAEAVAADAGAAEARAADAVAADALRRPVPVLDFLCQKELRIPAGGGPLALTADGLLVANVTERLLLRTTGTLACSGNLRFTAPPDADAAESHASSARPDALLLASGPGTLVLGPRDGVFTALALPADQGPLRVREAALFAVTAERLPTRQELGDATAGGAAAQAALWALRGPGLCVLWTAAPLRALRVVPGQACFVDPACFVGAYGELGLTARSEPGGAVYLECGGAGFVLLAPAPGSSAPGNEPTGADPLHT